MKLTPEQWQDAGDLLEQFSAQCDIAFEDHDKDAKRWVVGRLRKIMDLADLRGQHPRRSASLSTRNENET